MDEICRVEIVRFPIHLAPLPRRFPHATRVASIGYLPHKSDWVRQSFSSFNYSIILRGSGAFRMEGRRWLVVAPCVITQWPGVSLEYGPDRTWEELYLIYDASFLPVLEAARLARFDVPVWNVHDPRHLRRRIADLREHLQQVESPGVVDEVDRICEAMVLESWVAQERPTLRVHEPEIMRLRAYVEEHYLESLDFDALALEHGLSPASFRRYWAKYVKTPPARFVMQLRIRQGCRMLVETTQSVGEIAGELGFEDALYFSRKFRELTGGTATAYRREHLAFPGFGSEAQV